MEAVKNSIIKLNNNNYFNWKFKLEMIMQREGTWEVISEPTPETITTTWSKMDSMAKATIGLLVEDSQLVIIRNCETAKQMWKKLKETHQHANLSNRLYLLRKLYSSRYVESNSMRKHLDDITEIVDRLEALGESIKPNHIIAVMLCSLPPKYDPLITTIEAKEESELTVDYIRTRLVDEASRREEDNLDQEKSETALRISGAKPIYSNKNKACYNCRRMGHISRECRNEAYHGRIEQDDRTRRNYESYKTLPGNGKQSQTVNYGMVCNEQVCEYHENRSEEEDEEIAFTGTHKELTNKHGWIIDSGASSHMCAGKNDFQSLEKYENPILISLADGDKINAQGIGKVTIFINIKGKRVKTTLNNVLWVPELSNNLLSVKRVCEHGWTVHFKGKECHIQNKKGVSIEAKLQGPAFILSTFQYEDNEHAQVCIHGWHDKLGHKYNPTIERMAKENRYKGLKISNCNDSCKNICEPCLKGGMIQKPFKKEDSTTVTQPFQVLYADLCGPIKPLSLGKNKYFLTVTDYYSKYTFVSPIKTKDMTNGEMKRIIMAGFNKHGKFPISVRTDGGGEFFNNDMENFYKEKGIHHQMSIPHTPQQNGTSERKNRTIVETVRKMLSHANVTKSLWGEALKTAAYLYNRTANSLTMTTPYEKWEGRAPSYDQLQTFGEMAYYHVPKANRQKLDDTSIRGRFVGYGERHKGYRIWKEGTNNVIVSRSVKFGSIPEKEEKIKTDNSEQYAPVFMEGESDREGEIREPDSLRRSNRVNRGQPAERLSY